MIKDNDIKVRLNTDIKEKAERIWSEQGFTRSEVINALYQQTVIWGKIPFKNDIPTRNPYTHLDARVVVQYLNNKIENNQEYFELVPYNYDDIEMREAFDYLIIDANNYDKNSEHSFTSVTHPINPNGCFTCKNNLEIYYVVSIYVKERNTEGLFLYYDESHGFNPATIKFLGYGIYNEEPIFEQLHKLLNAKTEKQRLASLNIK